MPNADLVAAKRAKKDEFYTQYVDIQKEVEAYLEFDADTFRDKVVYCNCDDPFESNFLKRLRGEALSGGNRKDLLSNELRRAPAQVAQLTKENLRYIETQAEKNRPSRHVVNAIGLGCVYRRRSIPQK